MGICAKCGATIKHVYSIDGKDYGSECYKTVLGIKIEQQQKERQEKYIIDNEFTYICIDKLDDMQKRELKSNGFNFHYCYYVGQKEVEGYNYIIVNTKDVKFGSGRFDYIPNTLLDIITNYKKSLNTSSHIGSIKDKLTLKVTLIKEAGYSTQYGYTSIYIMKDENGNIFTWKTTKDIEKEVNDTFEIKGTVKDHTEYDYQLQTELTRCKIL